MKTKQNAKKRKRPDLAERNRSKRENLSGQQFNYLYVLQPAEDKHGRSASLCKCICGRRCVVANVDLKRGQKSCGCKTKEILSKCRETHGGSKTKLFGIWRNMRDRCEKENHKSYPRYGGRGIKVCDEWQDFATFRDWAINNGYDENAEFMKCTIDRKDNDGDYCPENCRWIDMKEQCKNRSNTIHLTYNGETHTIPEWAELTGIKEDTLRNRINKGWTEEEIICVPLKQRRITYWKEKVKGEN